MKKFIKKVSVTSIVTFIFIALFILIFGEMNTVSFIAGIWLAIMNNLIISLWED